MATLSVSSIEKFHRRRQSSYISKLIVMCEVNSKTDIQDYVEPCQTFHLSSGTISQSCHYAEVLYLFDPAYIRSISRGKQRSSPEDQICSTITLQLTIKLTEIGVRNKQLRIYQVCH